MTVTWANCQVTLGELKPWADNPRLSSKRQAQRILDSWRKFGQVQTVALGPSNEVYDGHQRLSALLTVHGPSYQVDARRCSRELSEVERRALVVTLHAGAVGSWNWDNLANWDAGELQEWGFDSETLQNWQRDVGALGNLLDSEEAESADAEPQIDRAAELNEKWQVKPGDLWRIGEHRLACGDCTDKAVVERVMGGEKAGACVTDPPYGQNQAGVTNDAPEQLQGIITGAITNLPVVDAVVLAFSSPRTFPVWLDTARAVGHKFERMLWLYKAAQETFPWRGWLLKSESILVTSVGNGQWQDVHPYSHDCYYKSEVSGQLAPNSGWHGSVKPLDVVQDLIARVSLVGGLVIDPFLGSGTTLVACQNLHRRGRGIEISPEYCAVVLERMATAFPGIEIERMVSA